MRKRRSGEAEKGPLDAETLLTVSFPKFQMAARKNGSQGIVISGKTHRKK
jgi:hypothetical protein